MKTWHTVTVLVMIFSMAAVVLHAHLQQEESKAGEPVLHVENSFDLTVKAPYFTVAPLFGAEGERTWGGADWNPQFLYPSPARDVPGAVFTAKHSGHNTLWITPTFDIPGRHIQHVIVILGAMITLIDITFPQSDPAVTQVHVTYERTALAATLNDHVKELGARDATEGPHWQHDIDTYLASKK